MSRLGYYRGRSVVGSGTTPEQRMMVQHQREWNDFNSRRQQQALDAQQRLYHNSMLEQQRYMQWQMREEYKQQVQQQADERERQKILGTIAKVRAGEPPYDGLSKLQKTDVVNQLTYKASELTGRAPAYVDVEVDSKRKYPIGHPLEGDDMEPHIERHFADGRIELLHNSYEGMLKEWKLLNDAKTAQERVDTLPPRFDPAEPGFDKAAREAAIKDQETFIEKEAVKAGEESRGIAERAAQRDEAQLKGDLENDYAEENEAYDESKEKLKAWEEQLKERPHFDEAEKNKELRDDPSRNFVEHNGRWYETSPKPTVGDRPRKPVVSEYDQDAEGKGSAAYREAYESKKRELERTLLRDAKERMRRYKGTASLGMPDVGNIASVGPSMAVNPDTGHQLTLEGDSWA